MNQYWFRPRRYGHGATPSSWEGWLVMLVYIGALVALAYLFTAPLWAGAEKPIGFVLSVFALTGALIWIAWRKTDGKWRWRWGAD